MVKLRFFIIVLSLITILGITLNAEETVYLELDSINRESDEITYVYHCYVIANNFSWSNVYNVIITGTYKQGYILKKIYYEYTEDTTDFRNVRKFYRVFVVYQL